MPPKKEPPKEQEQPVIGTGKFFSEMGEMYEGEYKINQVQRPNLPTDPKQLKDMTQDQLYYQKKVKHGKGVYQHGDYKYEGEFQEDNIQGDGSFYYQSGAVYKGQWNQNQYQGKGTYVWPDGKKYEGLWQEGQMHGNGIFTDNEGRQWTGIFHNGMGPGLRSIV